MTQARTTLSRQSDKTTSVPLGPSNHMPTTLLTSTPRFQRSTFFADPVHSPDLSCRCENDAAEGTTPGTSCCSFMAFPYKTTEITCPQSPRSTTRTHRWSTFRPLASTLVQPMKDEDATCLDWHFATTHTFLDALHLKLHLLATRTREHHRTPSYLSEAERLQSHTMLFARNSLVCKHTGYQHTERERTAVCLHRQLLCHARKVIVIRRILRLHLGTEH